MSIFTFNVDMSRTAAALERIAAALDRLAPAPRAAPAVESSSGPMDFSFAESPEQYHERTSHEAALAIELGVAPWSPAFQRAIDDLRSDIINSKVEFNEETGEVREVQYTREQADDIIRRSFALAKSQANERK